MGGACCVAKDKTIVHGPNNEMLHRNHRHSPTWSFRLDNRRRAVGEDTAIHWYSDGIRNSEVDAKYESAYLSQDESPQGTFERQKYHNSSISEDTTAHASVSTSDRAIKRSISMDRLLQRVKDPLKSPEASSSVRKRFSLSLPSTSSLSPPPLLSKRNLPPADTPKWSKQSQHQLILQAPDQQIVELKPSNGVPVAKERPERPSWNSDLTLISHAAPLDGWFGNAYYEEMLNSHRENWSFDNEILAFNHENMGLSDQISAPPANVQTCRACLKYLTDKSFFSSEKLIVNNELIVVGVLTCGHVYHADCLEALTPEINKFDPPCPICTLGEKQTHKMSHKAMKAEIELKAKKKKSRKQIVDADLEGNSFMFDCQKTSDKEGKISKMSSSSSMKIGSPFLRRHFSFRSKDSSLSKENHTSRKKGFFWTRSMKV